MFREIGEIIELKKETGWTPTEEDEPNNKEVYWVYQPSHPFTTQSIRLMRYFKEEGWPEGVTHFAPKEFINPPKDS